MQWGSYTNNVTGQKTITFPKSFTTVYSVMLTKEGTFSDSASAPYFYVTGIMNTNFKSLHYATIPTIHWIAIGIS